MHHKYESYKSHGGFWLDSRTTKLLFNDWADLLQSQQYRQFQLQSTMLTQANSEWVSPTPDGLILLLMLLEEYEEGNQN